jgi:pimeloyl-ACP methyl ester carboxylesterase
MGSLPQTKSSKYLKSADGTLIYADAIGDPSKPSVVFIHGMSMNSIVFDELFEDQRWIDRVYLVRYDTRGHGRSGMPTDAEFWQSKRLAEDFDAVVQAFELRRPFVAAWYAISH